MVWAALSESDSQQRITQSHGDTVHHRYGQITAPLDMTSGVRTARDSSAEAARTQTAKQDRPGRSERAHNAANQRHAKSKTVGRVNRRKDAALSDGEEGDTVGKRGTL